ncbi:hypothetical protein FSP39_006247 [Pinctada imbricata]|uniref:Uncharacterized protein n=1 Tax=Pinctada imbricata TaxID=66713 RepID=A0AA88XET9_PINIB|nr:hypothetical protein FSP39_006247 [Pinctada imbricata]
MASMQDLVKSMKDKPSSKQTVRGTSQHDRLPSQQRTANQPERVQSQPRGASQQHHVSTPPRVASQPRGASQLNHGTPPPRGASQQQHATPQPRGTSQQHHVTPPPRGASQQHPLSVQQDRHPTQSRGVSQQHPDPTNQSRLQSQPRAVSQQHRASAEHGREISSQPRVPSQHNPMSANQDRMPSQPRGTSQQPQSRAQISQPYRMPSQTHSPNVSRQREVVSGYRTGEDERSVRGPSPAKSLKMSHADQDPASFSRLSNASIKAPSMSGGLVQPIRVLTPKSALQPSKVKTPSNRSVQTRGSLKTQAEVDDDIDAKTEVYSEYYYPEYYPQSQHSERFEPRAVTSDGPESCGCFPKRSSRHVSSMLYEHVECVHTGLKGQTHQGVYRFEDNWNHAYEVPKERKTQMQPPDTRYVLGYPRPAFDPVSDGDDDEDDYDDDEKENKPRKQSAKSKPNKSQTGKTDKKKDTSALNVQQKDHKEASKDNKDKKDDKKATNQKASDKQADDEYYDSDEDDYQELSREDKYYPIRLPQIGYSPPPSRENSRLSARSQTYLPPLPESPHLTNQKRDQPKRQKAMSDVEDDIESIGEGRMSPAESVRSRRIDKPRQIERTRRFHGVYYDPGWYW